MNELDDFLCERQSDELSQYDDDSLWFWADERDLGMGIE